MLSLEGSERSNEITNNWNIQSLSYINCKSMTRGSRFTSPVSMLHGGLVVISVTGGGAVMQSARVLLLYLVDVDATFAVTFNFLRTRFFHLFHQRTTRDFFGR